MTFGELSPDDVFTRPVDTWRTIYWRKIQPGLAYDILSGQKCCIVDSEPVVLCDELTAVMSRIESDGCK